MRRRIQLPAWVVGIINPAQGYMQRQSGRRPPSRRPSAGSAAYGPLTERGRGGYSPVRTQDTALFLDVERIREERYRDRAAAVRCVMQEYRQVLDQAAHDIEQRGTAQLNTPTGEISARVIRFRWGASVLEIEGRARPTEKTSSSGYRMSMGLVTKKHVRVPLAGVKAEVAFSYLADMLADFRRRSS